MKYNIYVTFCSVPFLSGCLEKTREWIYTNKGSKRIESADVLLVSFYNPCITLRLSVLNKELLAYLLTYLNAPKCVCVRGCFITPLIMALYLVTVAFTLGRLEI